MVEQLSLSEFIRRRRNELSLTQAHVALRMGFKSPDYISLLEQGMRNLDLDKVPALAGILQIDAAMLCKMALEDQYPIMAKCLLKSTKSIRLTSPVFTEVDAAAEKLHALPREERQMVVNMVNMLAEKQNGQRVGKHTQMRRVG
jgi:transcriptional regulator with XRE-family HTH domain